MTLTSSVNFPGAPFRVILNFPGLNDLPEARSEQRISYEKIFESIPDHSTVLAAVSFPYFLDFSRHNIYLLDVPGLFAPSNVIRDFSQTTEFMASLKAWGIKYLVLTESDVAKGLYNETYWDETWKRNWQETIPFLKEWRKRFDSFFEFIRKVRPTAIMEQDGVFVIDLENTIASLQQQNS